MKDQYLALMETIRRTDVERTDLFRDIIRQSVNILGLRSFRDLEIGLRTLAVKERERKPQDLFGHLIRMSYNEIC